MEGRGQNGGHGAFALGAGDVGSSRMRPAGHHAVRGLHGPGQGLESFFEFADSTRALIQFVSQPAAKREVRRDVTEYVITVRNEMMRDRFRSVPRTTNGAKKSATKKRHV